MPKNTQDKPAIQRRSKLGLPPEAKLLRQLTLFAGGPSQPLPTKAEKDAVFIEVKAMEGTEWYTMEQHEKWCSGKKVSIEKQRANQDFVTNYVRSNMMQWKDAPSVVHAVTLIHQWSEKLGVPDETLYRIIRDCV